MVADSPVDAAPVPDPTERTGQQLTREIAWLRQLLEQRLDGMDRAVILLREAHDRFPTRLDEKITSLKEVVWEKFEGIQVQFAERDVRASQSAIATKTAVDAALQAAKEAVGAQNLSSSASIQKSEEATTKQFDQQGRIIETKTQALETQIADLKDRLTRIEGSGTGASSNQAATGRLVMLGIAVAGILFTASASGFFNKAPALAPPPPPVIVVQPSPTNSGATTTETSRTTSTEKGPR